MYRSLASATALAIATTAGAADFDIDTVAADGMFNNRPSVAVDDDGVIHVAYMTQFSTDDSSKEIIYATNAGGSWTHIPVTDNNVREEFPCLTLDQNGSVHMAFHTGVPNTNKIRYVNNVDAPSGEFNDIIDITAGGYVIAEVRIDDDGTAHFVFRTQTLSVPGEDVIYTTWSETDGVGPLVNLSNTPGEDAESPQVAVGPDGVVHVVYQDGWAFGGPLVYMNDAGGSLQPQPTSVAGTVVDPMLLVSDDNVVSILYRADSVLHAIDDGGTGTFSSPEPLFTGTFLPAFFERFAVDSEGNRHVAFASNVGDNRGIFYIGEDENGWQDPVHVAGDDTGNQGTSIAINDAGELALTYSLSGFDDVVFADIFAATTTLGDASCASDLTGDGIVNVSDLLMLLGEWGVCKACDADLNDDGSVNVSDMLLLLGAWGDC